MESTTTSHPQAVTRAASPRCWIGRALLAGALLLYGVLLARHMGAVAGGSDSSGYLNHARLLASGHVHAAPRSIPHFEVNGDARPLYSPLGFKPAANGSGLVPTYPAGLPLWLLVIAKFAGWSETGNVTLWLHAIAGVVLTYIAGRTFGLSSRGAVLGAAIVGSSPVYLMMSLQTMSDVPALVWTTAAVVAAWQSQKRIAWSLGAGAAFAIAVLVRPTDLLALAPVAVALGLCWRGWILFGIGGLPGAVFFCLHNHAAYGKYLTTGYEASADFGAEWIGVTLAHYAHWLPLLFTPLVIAFLGLPMLKHAKRASWLLGTWLLVFAAFYTVYRCTHETWWYLRFLLPAIPALVIGALLVLQQVLAARIKGYIAILGLCVALVGVVASNGYWTSMFWVLETRDDEVKYLRVCEWLEQHVPQNAVVAVMQQSGALFYYTPLTLVRWDNLDRGDFSRLTAALTTDGRPLYAALFPFEIEDQHAFTGHMPTGSWTQVGKVDDVTIWKWSER